MEVEDRGPNVPNCVVELVHDLVDSPARVLLVDQAQRALHAHPGGVEPLDHVIVQIPDDPVAVGEQLQQLLGLGGFQGQRRLIGEGAEHGDLLWLEGDGPLVPHSQQHAADAERR